MNEMASEIELNITDLARGGAGVSRESSGRVVFVPLTAPGDRIRARIVSEEKHYAQGELIEILAPSPLRQTPPCPVFGRCGGCQWQHLSYELQWQTKIRGVRHALCRVQVETPNRWDEMPAEQIWNYRNRIQLRGEGDQIGFFAPGTHSLVPISECKIARTEINSRIASAREKGGRLGRPFKVELTVSPQGEITEVWNSRHAAGGFTQVHDAQNEKLQQWVASAISSGRVLLDLFGGTGNLSFGIACRMTETHIVDVGAPSLPAKQDAATKVVFHRSAVLPWLLRARRTPFWEGREISAILDPPREGLAKDFTEIAKALELFGAREIVAVGCDPDAWARDLSRWTKRGWKLMRCGVVDLFPQTPHVESIALLRL